MADVTSLIDVRTSDRFGTCRIWKRWTFRHRTLTWRMLDPEHNSTMILHTLVTMCPIKQRHIPDDLWPSATLMWQLRISHGSFTFFIYAKMMNSSPHKWLPFISTRTFSNIQHAFSNSKLIFTSYALSYSERKIWAIWYVVSTPTPWTPMDCQLFIYHKHILLNTKADWTCSMDYF